MEQHVGSTFPGIISGVTSFGLFVELDESGVNGLVHVTQLPNDYYHFDPVRKLMTGERRRKQFRLGDRVSVLVLRASLEERKIDFRLVEDVGAPDAGGTGPAPATRKAAKKTARKAAKKATKKAAARKAAREPAGSVRGAVAPVPRRMA